MPIQFGVTCFFNDYKEFAIVPEVAKQFPLLKYLEFRGEFPFLVPDTTPDSQIGFFRDVMQKTTLRSTLHTIYHDINLATLNPWLKNANITCYKRFIDIAEQLGSELIVVHGGVLQADYVNSPLKNEFHSQAIDHLCETLRELAEYGVDRGVKIALENSPPEDGQSIVFDSHSHLQILKKVNHPNLGALLDFAHAFLRRLDLIDYLEKIKPYLVEIHAHNNMGKNDDHLALPDGKIDYLPIFKHPAVRDVPFIMELKSYEDVLKTLAWLGKVL